MRNESYRIKQSQKIHRKRKTLGKIQKIRRQSQKQQTNKKMLKKEKEERKKERKKEKKREK